MDIREIFSVLDIEPTKDTAEIKKAYRDRLRATNPEENPEGFKRLRAAYEDACAYAARPDEAAAAERKKTDDTPSGLWLERIREIYDDFASRRDTERWRQALDDDIFISLEEEENCRVKLLRFLMDHFRLPAAAWKLLDEKLGLVKDAPRLRERFRVDFINYVVSKCEQGEDIDFELFEGASDALYDLFLKYYDECWRALREGDLPKAEAALAAADALHIYHPAAEILRVEILQKQDRREEALERTEELLRKYPQDNMVRYNGAEVMWSLDRKETSAAIYEEMKRENDSHYMANYRLTEWYYSHGDFDRAKKCAEKVLRAGADDAFMEILMKVNSELENGYIERWERDRDWDAGMDLGWCWLQDGKICRGIQLTTELDKLKSAQPPEKIAAYNGLLTKLYVEGAEFEDAIYMSGIWEKSLEEKLRTDEDDEERERDRDRIRQAWQIRIQCCRVLGSKDPIYFDRAIEIIDRNLQDPAEGAGMRDIPLLLEKAQIYLEKGEYELCRKITDKLVAEYQVQAANVIAMDSWSKQWDGGGVLRCARQCIEAYPNYARAYEHAARVYKDLGYRDEWKAVLDEAEKNKVKSVILDAYRYQLTHEIPQADRLEKVLENFRSLFTRRLDDGEMDFYEKGLPILTEYLYWCPNGYMLRERALFHRSGRHYREALEDFEKSLAEDPDSVYAYRGMALTYLYMDDMESALIYMKRALLYLKGEGRTGIYAELALIYSRLNCREMALNAYRQYEQALGGSAPEAPKVKDMARMMALCGKRQEAYEKLYSFHAGGKDPFGRYEDLVELCQLMGQKNRAEELLTQWKRKLRAYDRTRIARKLAPGRLLSARGRLPAPAAGQAQDEKTLRIFWPNHAQYDSFMGWQALLYGDGGEAVRWFEKVRAGKAKDKRASGERWSDDDEPACLEDLIFACILTGDGAKGKKYAASLGRWLEREGSGAADYFFKAEKTKLWIEFLAEYYFAEDARLQQIIDREAETETCRHCTYCICKEMEAAQILLLYRQGRQREAQERLKRDLKLQPMEEFSMAIARFRLGSAPEKSGPRDG